MPRRSASSPRPRPGASAPHRIRGRDVTIEPDLSNAAPFLAAALVAGGTVTVPGWPEETTQVGDRLRDLLAAFGAEVRLRARRARRRRRRAAPSPGR